MNYSLTAAERATSINFDDSTDRADIITVCPVWIRKFDKLCEENPEQFKCVEWDTQRYNGKIIQKRYTFPKRFLSIRSKDREYTKEQKQAMIARFGKQ